MPGDPWWPRELWRTGERCEVLRGLLLFVLVTVCVFNFPYSRLFKIYMEWVTYKHAFVMEVLDSLGVRLRMPIRIPRRPKMRSQKTKRKHPQQRRKKRQKFGISFLHRLHHFLKVHVQAAASQEERRSGAVSWHVYGASGFQANMEHHGTLRLCRLPHPETAVQVKLFNLKVSWLFRQGTPKLVEASQRSGPSWWRWPFRRRGKERGERICNVEMNNL